MGSGATKIGTNDGSARYMLITPPMTWAIDWQISYLPIPWTANPVQGAAALAAIAWQSNDFLNATAGVDVRDLDGVLAHLLRVVAEALLEDSCGVEVEVFGVLPHQSLHHRVPHT